MDTMHARMRGSEQAEPEEAQPVVAEPHRYVSPRPPVQNHVEPPKQKIKLPKWVLPIAIAVTIIGLSTIVWKTFFSGAGADGIDHSKYQAVLLSGGNLTYFGKLERLSDGYYKMTDVYLMTSEQASKVKEDNTLSLVKVTQQFYSPDNEVILPREQVLQYQNMSSDSKISQYIKQDTQKK